jgi:hypothetical protein
VSLGRGTGAARLFRLASAFAAFPQRRPAPPFIACLSIVALVLPDSASAFDHAWRCFPRTDFEKFEVHEDKLILDYLLVREEKGTLSGLPVVTFSYSVVNKQDRNIHIDAELVGLAADGSPVLAISASPPSSLVASQASRSVANSVYTAAGQLNRAAKLCVSFGGDF